MGLCEKTGRGISWVLKLGDLYDVMLVGLCGSHMVTQFASFGAGKSM